jgi:uncharacterized membrane protein
MMAAGWAFFVGQANASGANAVILWSAILLALLLVLFFLYNQLKRWMREPDEPAGVGFTLSDLRELHRQGKMSDEEFEKTKAKIVASAKRVADQMPEVLAKRRKPEEKSEDKNL